MNWLNRLLRARRIESQLERELQFHIDQHAADLQASGYDPAAARRIARMELGGPEQVKEQCRDARGTRWFQDFVHDVRYSLRSFRRTALSSIIAILTLALGISAATVVFTVVDGVLLRPVPYPHPHELVRVQEKTDWSTIFGDLWAFSYPNYLDCANNAHSLDMAAWQYAGWTSRGPASAEYINGLEVSANYFSVLQVSPAAGRYFNSHDDDAGAPPVVVLNHDLWQRRFHASLAALGQTIILDEKPYTIIGIAPPSFHPGGGTEDAFTLLRQDNSPRLKNRAVHSVQVWARLRPGFSLSQAQAELSVIGRQVRDQFPASNRGRTFVAEALVLNVGDARSTLWLLLGAVMLVLTISCVNVASLLLARAISRERELAMRTALGARRGRLIRQCLTESALLAVTGGAIGTGMAAIALRPFIAFWPSGLPRQDEVHLNWRVLSFALAVSLLSGLLFGIAPALRAPFRDLERALRAGARAMTGRLRGLHAGFVIAEVALAMVLLVCAGTLAETMLRLSSRDAGLNVRGVLTARVALPPSILADPSRTRAAWNEILERGRNVPGVEAVAAVDTVPLRAGNNQIPYRTSAAVLPPDQQPVTLATSVTPEYLRVMGIPLLKGRFFSEQDGKGSTGVAVIDEVFARRAFPDQDALGKSLWIDLGPDPVRVIGVVGHVRHWGPAIDDDARVRAQLYYPFAQVPDPLVRRWSELMSIAVRTRVEPLGIIDPLRRAIRGISGDQALYEVRTMEDLARSALARQRFLLLLFGMFSGLALLLACVGIYGVMAYLTAQRIPEMGLRMAIGARPFDVVRLVIGQSASIILTGVVLGAAAALGAARILQLYVQGVKSTEPGVFAAMVPMLIGAALLASFLPARRAARIDPMKALRQE